MKQTKELIRRRMKELTWDDFKKLYEPVKQWDRNGLNRYLLDIHDPDLVEVGGKNVKQGKINYEKALHTYAMYIWTVNLDNTIVSGKKFSDVLGYIICTVPHYVDEVITVKIQ